MSRSPADLRAAAVALRALADALTADFDGLATHSGPATWEGPAAAAHQHRAAGLTDDAHAVAAEVRGLAARLEDRAAEQALSEAATAPGPGERPPSTSTTTGGRSGG